MQIIVHALTTITTTKLETRLKDSGNPKMKVLIHLLMNIKKLMGGCMVSLIVKMVSWGGFFDKNRLVKWDCCTILCKKCANC